MNDYSKLSDFEINKRVGDILKLEWANLDQNYNGLCYWKDCELFVFNPIKNVNDAWPIITNNLISIDWHFNGSYKRVWGYSKRGLIELKCLQFDVLRAAMIVFLHIQEDKQ
nr:MAG: Protein of unknown function (DUF2591) [Bacteriophage sp.]